MYLKYSVLKKYIHVLGNAWSSDSVVNEPLILLFTQLVMSRSTACVVGSTVLVIECAEIILQHDISIEHIFTDDQAVCHWAAKQLIATSSHNSFQKYSSFSQFDYLFSIVNDTVVRKNILGAFRKLCINYHDGPLPRYSGVGASQWALIRGETTHGISWHIMEAQVDSGLVLEQMHFTIEKSDDLFTVNMKCRKAALSALQILCTKLKQGEWKSVPQKLDISTKHMFESKPSAFCMLPFHQRAVEVKNFFRGTFTLSKLPQINLLGLPKILLPTQRNIAVVGSLEISNNCSNAEPGTVVKVDNNHIHIATHDNDVIVSDLRNVDGTPLNSRSILLGANVSNALAHDECSSLHHLSKLATKYERTWMKKLSRTKAYCNNIPDELTCYVLGTLPLSLTIEPNASFRECLTTIGQNVASILVGDMHQGIRQDLVCSDIYSRYPGIISEPSNVFGITTNPEQDKSPNCRHEVVLISTLVSDDNSDSVLLKALIKNIAKIKYVFCNFEDDFEAFINSALADPDRRLAELPLTNPQRLNQQIKQYLTGNKIPIKSCCVHEPIEESAKLFPHVTAVVDDCYTHTTYGEIMRRSCDIAHYLKQSFMPENQFELRVALLLGRTCETISAMLAVLKLGGCFVMMESCPSKHLAYIIESCKLHAVLVNADAVKSHLVDLEETIFPKVPFIYTDTIPAADAKLNSAFQFESSKSPISDGPAVIVSTSGTTGKPKSVVLKHSSICNYVRYIIEQFSLQKTERKDGSIIDVGEISLACTSFNFDGSLHDVLPILWLGGTLYFHPLLHGKAKQWKSIQSCVTFFFTQPIKLPYFNHERFCSLRNLSVGGESFSLEMIQPWFAPKRKVWNIYGPCETTIGCSVGMVTKEEMITLGNPISNVVLQILNPLKQPVPIGVPGELHIGGVGVSLMYTEAELNKKAFWIDSTQMKFYKTNDLVVLGNGKLHFISRIPKSQEVKLHGIRIELSGVKNVINQISGVIFTHVEIESVAHNKPKLVVYIATKSSTTQRQVSKNVRRTLKREFSSFNIPTLIIPISEYDIPSTPAGKLDLKKLTSTWSCSFPAKTEVEELVLESYRKSLELDDVTQTLFGMESDFFEYGGNSIAVVSLAEELSTLLNKSVSTNDILESQTPKRLLEAVSQRSSLSLSDEVNDFSSSRKVSSFQEALISNNTLQVGPTYNLPYVLRIHGNINSLRLNVVLEVILSHLHSAYKQNTTNSSDHWSNAKGNYVRHVNSLSHESDGESNAMSDIQMDSVLPINYKLCPFRCTVYSISNTTVIVSIVLHHLVFDQQTLLNIDKALTDLYKDPSTNLQDIEPYSYFISCEEQRTKSSGSSSLTFWKNLLKGCTPFVDFPTTFARTANLKYHGNFIKRTLSSEMLNKVFQFCAHHRVSQPSLFLATYGLLIHRFSHPTQSFAIGCTMSLRSSVNNQLLRRKFQKMFGIMVNVVPCVFPLAKLENSPDELVNHVSKWFQNAMNHSWYPFSELVKLWCGDNETPLRLPQFLFNFLSITPDKTLEMGQDICVERVDVHTYTAKAELLLEVTAAKNGIFEVSLEYNTGLFSRYTATEMLNEYCALLHDVIQCNKLPPVHCLSNLSQQTIALAHFHHSPVYDCKLTKQQHAIYQCQVAEDQHVQFHSCFSVNLNEDIEVLQIVETLEQFPQLALTVCKMEDDVFMAVREGTKLQIQFEHASGSEEATNIKQGFFSWPMDIHSITEPLFRCVVIENSSTKQKELFCVSHCMLLDEISLRNLVIQLLGQLRLLETPSTTNPYGSLLKKYQHGDTDSTHHSLLCHKTVLPLQIYEIHLPQHLSTPTVRKFNFNLSLEVTPDEYVSFCCLLSALLLSKLQQSSHVHFALQCPDIDTPLTSNEALLPVCVDINTEASLSHMISTMQSRLRSIYAQVLSEDYFYWDTSVDINPFTSPLHEMLVKILPSTVPSNLATVSYPQRFPLCVAFCYNCDEVQLMSLLGHEQTNQAQKCLESLIQSLQQTGVSKSTAISELKMEYTPSVLKVNPQCEDADLSEKVLRAFNEHNHQVLFCEPTSQLDSARNDLLYTYNETKRLADHLSKRITQVLTEKNSMIAILVGGGVTLPVCMLASILNDQCFTVLDAASSLSNIREKLSAVSISLMLVDVQSLHILEEMLDLLLFPLIIVDPYLGESSLRFIASNVQPVVSSTSTSDSVTDSSFLVFTSGSTGVPKPVPVLRKPLVNFLEWFKVCAFENTPLRVLHYSGHSFDLLVAELLVQFLCGGTLIITDSKFKLDIKAYTLPLMIKYSIEALYLVPTVIGLMLHNANFSALNLPHLRHILSTGEKLQRELCSQFFLHFQPGKEEVILHNWGGPSECCIAIAHCKVNKETDLSEIPYGYLVPGCEAMVCGLNSHTPVPLGYAGEVLLSGAPVFDGYIQTSKDIQTPFTYIDGKKWYCTGDIAMLNHKGQLVYLQRLDKQVKISGQRINLSGVRSQILGLNLSYLLDIVVLHIDQHLLCFPLISDNDSKPVDELTVQRDLSIHLSGKLVPTVVKCMTRYPMLSSQKINHKKLKEIAQQKLSSSERDMAEQELVPNAVTEKFIHIIKRINPYLSSVRLSHSLDELGFTSINKVQFYEELLKCEEYKHLSLESILVARNLQELINKANFKLTETAELSSPLNRSNILSIKETSTAIIGMHVQVAGASNTEEFWDIIEQKRETITHNIPIDAQTELEQRYGGARYIGSRGLLESELCKRFDTRLFGISESDAIIMDPQQRLLLHAVWNAFEIAGYDPIRFGEHGSIGVFAGTEFPSYLFNVLDTKSGQPSDQIVWQNLRDNVALRISREFDCRGPCVSVANNCSTFMVALHLAHRSLLLRECDMAIVATATISGRRTGYLSTSKDIYSKDGHCRPFSSTASGTVMSDGVAVVILRRFNDAQTDDDNIECLIKSTSIGCDGSLAKERQLTPSSVGQASVLMNALANVFDDESIDFSSIGLIEAHGTGTTAGDQVEIESFKKVSNHNSATIPIGSIKGNIGHTGVTSAGPAVVKAALALKKAKLPPSINCNDPSGHLKRTNFYVNTEMREWISPGKARRALVHSIGAMGSNAATILEQYYGSSNEHQNSSSDESETAPFPVCISANSQYSLNELLARLNRHLTLNTALNLKSLAYTLLYSRRFLPLRVAHVCPTKEDFAEWISSCINDICVSKVGKLCCVMLSGQGALIQLKSLRTLSTILPRFKEKICDCFSLLKQISSNLTYSSLNQLFDDSNITVTEVEDLQRKVAKSACLQTSVIVSAQVALYHSLKQLGLKTDCFVGHSLGEYTAAHLAGVLSLKDILRLVHERGKLIESSAQRGEMLSILASPDEIKEMCSIDHKGVTLSCLNSPRHCVASGTPTDIGRLSIQLTHRQIHHKKLKMDYAYHHPNMAVIQERFSMILKNTTLHALTSNLITSTEGQVCMHVAGTYLSTDYWSKHLVTPCDFLSTVVDCLSIHCKDFNFVEMGLVPTYISSFCKIL